MSRNILISIVVPCFNEEEVLPLTHAHLRSVLENIPYDTEIVYVDDGSRDKTGEMLEAMHAEDERVKVLRLSRNYGHQIAVTAGLDAAQGDAVVLIDADLQDPPEVILEMIERWRDGYDVAYGQRIDREGETAFKLWTAKLFYRLINRLSNIQIPLDTGDFRLMDRKVVDGLCLMREQDRFIRGMVTWTGFRQTAVPYHRASRAAGETKYPFSKMLRFAIDAIISFSTVPLRLATAVGFIASAFALVVMGYSLLAVVLQLPLEPGWASLLISVSFIGGCQLICLGIIGEYVGRIYREAKRRPLYLLRTRLGLSSPRSADDSNEGRE